MHAAVEARHRHQGAQADGAAGCCVGVDDRVGAPRVGRPRERQVTARRAHRQDRAADVKASGHARLPGQDGPQPAGADRRAGPGRPFGHDVPAGDVGVIRPGGVGKLAVPLQPPVGDAEERLGVVAREGDRHARIAPRQRPHDRLADHAHRFGPLILQPCRVEHERGQGTGMAVGPQAADETAGGVPEQDDVAVPAVLGADDGQGQADLLVVVGQ